MTKNSAAEKIDFLYGSPTGVISDCLRGFLIPKEGYDFIGVDFSAIEARVLAWLAHEKRVIEIFKGDGLIYEFAAAGIYGVDIDNVTKAQRQIGKVAVLALGYQGGVGAFQSMAKNYGVVVTDTVAEEIKKAWRIAHPNIVKYWFDLERAAISAIDNPGKKFSAGSERLLTECTFLVNGSFLWCLLPSKRTLCYPYPKLETFETPWGEPKRGVTYMGVDTYTKKWCRQKTYGGSLAENVTQAVARDLLVNSLFEFSKSEIYTPVMHVHDEVLLEVPKGEGSVEEVEKIATQIPAWARGLPMGAEAWRGNRYRK